jgi:hypothetical protein
MGSAGRKGRGFQRVRVTECEDCLAVWKRDRADIVWALGFRSYRM